MRVWELAQELEATSASVLAALRDRGEWVTSHLNVIPGTYVQELRSTLGTFRSASTGANGSSISSLGTDAASPNTLRPASQPSSVTAPHSPEPRAIASADHVSDPRPGSNPFQPSTGSTPRRRRNQWARRRPGPKPVTYQPDPVPDPYDDDYYLDPREQLRYQPLLTTRDVAELCGVRPATVRQWVKRGYLTPSGTDGPSNLFNTPDVLQAETAVSARRRHRAVPRPQAPATPVAVWDPSRSSRHTDGAPQILDLTPLPPASARRLQRSRRPPVAELHRLARVHPKLILTTADAAALLGLTPATIRSWVHRGRLAPISGSSGARNDFRLTDVLHAAGHHPS